MIGKVCSRSVCSRSVGGLLAVVLAAGGLAVDAGAVPPAVAAADAAFVPVVPGRLMDTRPGQATVDGAQAGGGRVGAGGTIELQVGGRHGVPANAAAVMLNVTAVAPDAPGFLTVFPCGSKRPLASSVNFSAPGVVVPNAVLAKVGSGGKVCIYSLAATDVVVDLSGFVPGGGGNDPGDPGDPGGTIGAASVITPDFAEQHVTIGDDGVAHMVYVDAYGASAWYDRCAANCSDSGSWTSTELMAVDTDHTSSPGSAGIAVDASGRVHILFDGWTFDDEGFHLRYATCASNCTSAGAWSITQLDDLGFATSANATQTLMVAPDGQVSFVAAGFDANIEYAVKYFECGGDCSSLANWTMSNGFVGYPLVARRDAGGTTHLIFNPSNFDTDALGYARCASGCTASANWEVSSNTFVMFDGASLAVTDSGRVFIGYLQNEIGDSRDRRFLVNSCAGAGCMDLSTWASFAIGDDWEGWDGSWLETSGDEVLLLTTASEELRSRWCGSNCHTAASWGETMVVDTNAAIGDDVNPVFHAETSLCDSADPNWWTQSPVAAMTDDRVIVAHNPTGTYVCYPDTTIYPIAPIGRVIADF